MWQGALRGRDDPLRVAMVRAIEEREPITVELLYSDLTGRQRAITRFGLLPPAEESEDPTKRYTAMSRLWFLDIDGPRPDGAIADAIATIRAETGTMPVDG